MSSTAALFSLMVIDDDPAQHELIAGALEGMQLDLRSFEDPREGLAAFRARRADVVLLDMMMPGINGIEVLKGLLEIDPGTEVILMTAHYSSESAVEAIRSGAADYLTKPVDLQSLRERMRSLLADHQRRHRVFQLEDQLAANFQFCGIVGRSPLVLDVYSVIRRIAPHYRTVLISGATGTGKELVAQAIHSLSPVGNRPLVVCNCSAMPDTLLESELFGYVKGSFTGAAKDKVGLFEHANGSAIFLDEIGEMPLNAQPKLLRVLQNQEIQRVGAPATRKVDVRVIAATNRSLRAMVSQGSFREDLYYRLSMVEIAVPRLGERKEDLPLLQHHFVRKFSREYGKPIDGISRRAQVCLARWNWPGNVRELENVIGNACMMTASSIIDVQDLPGYLRTEASSRRDDELLTLDEAQRHHVLKILEMVKGDKTRAASVLGISRTTLYRILFKAGSAGESEAS